ncbi:hypothetical protein AAK964_10085 [Tissierella praeacuta]|uniref:hypothetical protein n=1 Tax=Tissierella praeacuta TaxID=43131 RepID=UPI0035111109
MDLKEKKTLFILLTTALWVIITICGWTGHWLLGMVLGVVLMLLYMILGAAKKGVLSRKLLFYPFSIWSILWILSFILSDYHSKIFDGMMPSYTILGLHPSFAWTVFTYWIGGVLTLTLGFVFYKDLWLSKEDWNDFKKKIGEINTKKGVS